MNANFTNDLINSIELVYFIYLIILSEQFKEELLALVITSNCLNTAEL